MIKITSLAIRINDMNREKSIITLFLPSFFFFLHMVCIDEMILSIQAQRRARIHHLRLEKGAAKAAEELEKCNDTFLLLPVILWSLLPLL